MNRCCYENYSIILESGLACGLESCGIAFLKIIKGSQSLLMFMNNKFYKLKISSLFFNFKLSYCRSNNVPFSILMDVFL